MATKTRGTRKVTHKTIARNQSAPKRVNTQKRVSYRGRYIPGVSPRRKK